MSARLHPVAFAAVLGAVCALVLEGVAAVAGPLAQRNEEAYRARHLLSALGVPVAADAGTDEILEPFARAVRTVRWRGETIYVREEAGAPVAYAVEILGNGLWGPMRGVLALDADGEHILAVSFFEQTETPGLGGEVASPEFSRRFAGKRVRGILDDSVGIRVTRPGTARGLREIDGITGATITSKAVEAALDGGRERILRWREGSLAGGS